MKGTTAILRKLKRYLCEEWQSLLVAVIFFALILVSAIYVTTNNDTAENDKLFWVGIIVIGLLINLFSSCIVILFFQRRDRVNKATKERLVLMKAVSIVHGICRLFGQIYKACMSEYDNEISIYDEPTILLSIINNLDYSTNAPVVFTTPSGQIQHITWSQYLHKEFGDFFQDMTGYYDNFAYELDSEALEYLGKFTVKSDLHDRYGLCYLGNPQQDNQLSTVGTPTYDRFINDLIPLLKLLDKRLGQRNFELHKTFFTENHISPKRGSSRKDSNLTTTNVRGNDEKRQ